MTAANEEKILMLLEQQSGRFDKIDARFDKIDVQFEEMDARFDKMDARFEEVDARFDKMDVRFDKMDVQFEEMDERLSIISDDVALLKVQRIEDSKLLNAVHDHVVALSEDNYYHKKRFEQLKEVFA